MKKPQIILHPYEKALLIQDFESVLDCALANGVELHHSCGGMGSCTTCRILVESDLSRLPERNEIEQEMAEMKGFRPEERLACQLKPFDQLIARIPDHKE